MAIGAGSTRAAEPAPQVAVVPADDPSGEAQAAAPPDDAEIARALAADAAAQTKAAGASPGPASPSAPSSPSPQARAFQSLNPDISALVDFAAGWFSDDSGTLKAGDDPQSSGFKVQEIELALQQVVDPYFRADIFLTIPNLSGIEVEEAFLTTTQLPGNLQLKAGIFRAGLGRQNAQHLHLQDFTRRPALSPLLLGVDGLRAPGLEASWLVPGLPFYLMVTGAAFSVDAAEVDQPLQTFGGGGRGDLAYVGTARAFFPLAESTSMYLGLDYAHGKSSQSVSDLASTVAVDETGHTALDGRRDDLFGADLYVKWKPANQAETYASVAWQTEYFLRRLAGAGGIGTEREGALYSQVVAQMARRMFVGLRGELTGVPAGDNLHREYAGALSLTWALSEFARVRAYGEVRRRQQFAAPDGLPGQPGHHDAAALFLQLEAAIGAHGAHPF